MHASCCAEPFARAEPFACPLVWATESCPLYFETGRLLPGAGVTVLDVAVELEPGVGGLEGREDGDERGVSEERLDDERDGILCGWRAWGTAVEVEVVEWDEVEVVGDDGRKTGFDADNGSEGAVVGEGGGGA